MHLGAPGVDVLTTGQGGAYVTVSGTSAAAPLVAGVAGLLKTLRGWVSAQTLRKSLFDSARKSAFLHDKVTTGGVVAAGAAITLLSSSGNGNPNGGGNSSSIPGGPPPIGGGTGGSGGGGQPSGINIDFIA